MPLQLDIIPFINTSLTINSLAEETEFVCNQPEIINGAYDSSNYILVQCIDLPDWTRIYVNSGEFGFVKNSIALIKLNEPLKTGNDIWVYVATDNCNVESCRFTIGGYISSDESCTYISDNPISGTLTGMMICLGQDLHREVYDQYGNKTVGVIVQEDCIYCGGNQPNCD